MPLGRGLVNPSLLAKMHAKSIPAVGGELIGYVKSKPFGNGQIISIDDLVIVVIIAVFHKKLI